MGVGTSAVVLAAVLASCSRGATVDGPKHVDVVFQNLVDNALSTGTVDDAAKQFLEELKPRGAMTFEDYRRGLTLYDDCLHTVSIEVRFFETTNEGTPDFFYGLRPLPGTNIDPAKVHDIGAHCQASVYLPIASTYLSQQSSIDRRDAYFERFRQPLAECLAKLGLKIPPDAPYDEVMNQVKVALDQHNTDCRLDTGYTPANTVPADGWG